MIKQSIKLTLICLLICGVIYPALLTGVSTVFFNSKSQGSLLSVNGQIIGSELIGQDFTSDKYFKGRLIGELNGQLTEAVLKTRIEQSPWKGATNIPEELVTISASNSDPDISVEAAKFQVPYISKATDISESDLNNMIDIVKQGKQLGFIGSETVNVLKLNIAVEEKLQDK